MSDLEPLDPDLRQLFADERASYVEDHAARDAVHRRLQAAILLAPLATGAVAKAAVGAAGAGAGAGAGAAGAASGGAGGAVGGGVAGGAAGAAGALGWKAIAIASVVAFAGGVAANEGRHRASTSSPVSVVGPSDRVGAPTTSVATTSAPAPSPPTSVVANDPDVGRSSAASPATSATPANPSAGTARTNASAPGDVAAERALIDTARMALARGLASDALAATDAHAKRFPRGSLGEEREAIAIQALVATGARSAARSRAERFRKAYPSSIFGAAVQSAVEGTP